MKFLHRCRKRVISTLYPCSIWQVCNEEKCKIYQTPFERPTVFNFFYHQNPKSNIRIYDQGLKSHTPNLGLWQLHRRQKKKEKKDMFKQIDRWMKRTHCFTIWNTNCTRRKLWTFFSPVERSKFPDFKAPVLDICIHAYCLVQ